METGVNLVDAKRLKLTIRYDIVKGFNATMISMKSLLFLLLIWCLLAHGALHTADARRTLTGPAGELDMELSQRNRLVKSSESSESGTSKSLAGKSLSHGELVEYEIRYVAPEADKVYILWGLDGWHIPEESTWPANTIARDGYPYSEMEMDGKEFTITLKLPERSTVDYCFNVLSAARGLDVWDTNGEVGRDYHSIVTRNGGSVVMAADYSDATEILPTAAQDPPWLKRSIPCLLIVFLLVLTRRKLLQRSNALKLKDSS